MAKYILGDIFEGNHPISQGFANNPSYYSQFGFAGHEGIDWAMPVGVKLFAPFDYKIVRDDDDPKSGAYGDYIVLWDPVQKCAVWFCHLSKDFKNFGDTGKKGDLIALSGNTGNTSGPHLHFNFCETDTNGARINTNNGFKGFLNALNPSLVEWQLGVQNPGTIGGGSMYKGYDLTNQESMKVAVDVLVRVQAGDFVDKSKYDADMKSKQETLDNLNQQINDRNNDIVQLNAQISTLNARVLEIETQNNSLAEQAKKLPQLEKEHKELTEQREKWQEAEKTYNRTVAQLRSDLEEAKKDAFKTWITDLFDRLLRRK